MPPSAPEQLNTTLETLYRSESGRVLAALVLLGDLDLIEESMLLYAVAPRFDGAQRKRANGPLWAARSLSIALKRAVEMSRGRGLSRMPASVQDSRVAANTSRACTPT